MNWDAITRVAAKQMTDDIEDAYRVDWSDQFFPEVVRCRRGHVDATTYAAAKAEILDFAREQIAHWRAVAKRTRSMRKSDVTT